MGEAIITRRGGKASSPVCTVSIDSAVGITSVSYTNGSDKVTTLSLADGQKAVDLYDVKQGSLMFFGLEYDRYYMIEERTDTDYVIAGGHAYNAGEDAANGAHYVDEPLTVGKTYLVYLDGVWYEIVSTTNSAGNATVKNDYLEILDSASDTTKDLQLYVRVLNNEETTHTFALAQPLKVSSTGVTLMPESDGKSYAVSVGNGDASVSITH